MVLNQLCIGCSGNQLQADDQQRGLHPCGGSTPMYPLTASGIPAGHHSLVPLTRPSTSRIHRLELSAFRLIVHYLLLP